MQSSIPKTLAFRYLYVSSVVKEDLVTVFGQQGSEFVLGTDYDAMITYEVPSSELSNFVPYYNGGILNGQQVLPNGLVGSSDVASQLSTSAPVKSIEYFNSGYKGVDNLNSPATGRSSDGQYNLGDVILFDPANVGATFSENASCWTCIRATSTPADPLPLYGSVPAGQIYRDALPGATGKFAGFYGQDQNQQNFITGVVPAYYTAPGSTMAVNPATPNSQLVVRSSYWQESQIAQFYDSRQIYYAGQIVVFGGAMYECISTRGDLAIPSLFLNPEPATATTIITAPGTLVAPNGAYGYDFSGQRYLQSVPPSGGLFSSLFWNPSQVSKVPTSVFALVNWDNLAIHNKLNSYDANIGGGNGAQIIPSFKDDLGINVTTLGQIYSQNEAGFSLEVANAILARIPAAAIKSQSAGVKATPDSSLVQMVHTGPTKTSPTNYSPAVQGVFEESIYRDMLSVDGTPSTIQSFVVAQGSQGYFQDGSTGRPQLTFTNTVGGKPVLATNPSSVPLPIDTHAYVRCGVDSVFVDKSNPVYAADPTVFVVGDVITFVLNATIGGTTEPMFFVPATALVKGVSTTGKILSVEVTNPGDGYLGVPGAAVSRTSLTANPYLTPIMKVTSIRNEYKKQNPTDDSWGFTNGLTYAVQYGSGSGAVAYASIVSGSGSGASFASSVSFDFANNGGNGGSKYVVTNYVKDIVKICDPTNPNTLYLPAEVQSIDANGGITSVKLLKQGSGYLRDPILNVAPPPSDPSAQAILATQTYTDAGLMAITQVGKYRPGYLNETSPYVAVSSIGSTWGSVNPYLGINYVDIVSGGQGYLVGEPLEFRDSAGEQLQVPSLIASLGSTGGTFSVDNLGGRTLPTLSILYGGSGYKAGSKIILDGPTGTTGQLVCEVLNTGGNVTSLGFSSANLVGVSFKFGDVVDLGRSAKSYAGKDGDTLVAKVTSVGKDGQLYSESTQKGGTFSEKYSNDVSTYLYLADTGYTGEIYGNVVFANEVFKSVRAVNIVPGPRNPYSGIPNVTIAAPDAGTSYAGFVFPSPAVTAEAVASMALVNVSIQSPQDSSGFVTGDVFYFRQASPWAGATATATVIQTGVNGSVTALGVERAGTDFDPAQAFTFTTNTLGGTYSGGFNVTPQVSVGSIRVTKGGWGYSSAPTASLDAPTFGSTPQLQAVIGFGGGGAQFGLTGLSGTDISNAKLQLLSRGSGYVTGELLAIEGPFPVGGGTAAGGLFTFADETVGGNILAATVDPVLKGTKYNVGTYTSELDPAIVANQPPGFGGASAGLTLTYSVLTTGDPSSISGITVLESISGYTAGSVFTHKKLPDVRVQTIDANGAVTALEILDPGYGFNGLPSATIRGSGAAVSLNVPYLGVSRAENTFVYQGKNSFTVGTDTLVSRPFNSPAATAYTTISGDLYPITVDAFKNPNLLTSLENTKPGSTTCYGQGVASMSLALGQGVLVVHSGKNLGDYANLGISISAPTGKNPRQATAIINAALYDPVTGVSAVTVTDVGAGYLTPPIITLTYTGAAPTDLPIFKAQMVVSGVEVTGRGLGYNPGIPPTVTFADSDVTPGTRATGTATLKTTLSSLSVESSGAQYLSVPDIRVISQGTGAEGYVRMGVSDIEVVNGGNGFLVGDVLTFGLFGVTGTAYSYGAAVPIPELGNTGPISDGIFIGGTTLGTRSVCATVSAVTGPLNAIHSIVINSNAYQGTTDIYGGVDRALSADDFLKYGGAGYGVTKYVDSTATTWTTVETMPRVTGFYRPSSDPLVQQYLTAGVTLQNSLVPWIDTNNTVLTGLTFADGLTYLSPLTFVPAGLGLTAMFSGNLVTQPSISCRLAVQDYDLYGSTGQGSNFVCDAQVLIEKPPPSQQARYEAIISGGQVTGYTQISGGDGYVSVPNVSINGGGGNGALATANLGVTKIHIVDGGTGSSVGDIVTVINTGSGESATGIVTVIDDGVLGVGKEAKLSALVNFSTLPTLSYAGGVSTIVGAGISGQVFVNTEGYGYKVGEILPSVPDYANPLDGSTTSFTQISIDSPTRFSGVVPLNEAGTAVSLKDLVIYNSRFFLGQILSIAPSNTGQPPPTGAPSGLRAIVLVNTIHSPVNYSIISLFDSSNTFITTGKYATSNNDLNVIQRGGGIPDNGVKQQENAQVVINFIFLGWSDGTNGTNVNYGTTDRSAIQWWQTEYWNISETNGLARTPASLQIQQVNDQQNGVVAATVLTVGSGGFFGGVYPVAGTGKGSISYISVVNQGSAWKELPDPSHLTIVQNASGAVSNTSAVLVPSLSVVGLSITSPGLNYVAAPTIQIDAPLFRSLPAQLYSRSAEIFNINSPPTNDLLAPGGASLYVSNDGVGYLAGGVYKLVVDPTVGGLHQAGNASNSLDSFIILGGSQFSSADLPVKTLENILPPDAGQTSSTSFISVLSLTEHITSSGTKFQGAATVTTNAGKTLLEQSEYIQKGSNYRVGESYKLVAYGPTPPPTTVAVVQILRVTSTLNYDPSPAPGINTGTGIVDRGLKQNGEDVGGYGAGYVTIPKIRIVGGSQGIVPSLSLSLVGVDFGGIGTRGTGYKVNDQVWSLFKELGPRQVGIVSTVLDDTNGSGQIGTITLFTPRTSGLQTLPTISVVRLGAVVAGSVDATLKPVLGVEKAQMTNTTDGFIGKAFIEVDSPRGAGYIVPLSDAVVSPNMLQMIDTVKVTQPDSSLVLYQSPPLVQIEQPPFVHTYSGWNGLHFDAGDSFDFIVQYTVAKAVAFQVDPDVTLTGPYQTATSISIGGVTIPLRAPGASNSQGRELSANKVVYRYLVKLLAV